MKIQLRLLQGISLLTGVLVMAGPAQAASFDCAKAATKVEKLICGHADLSKLDDTLHDAYHQLLKTSGDKAKVKTSQRHWLKTVRNRCQDEACLQRVYSERLHALQQGLAVSGSVPNSRGKFVLAYDLPKIQHKYNKALPPGGTGGFCQAFTDNLNQFRQIDFDTCNPRLSPKYPRFTRPAWKEIPLDLALAKKMTDIRHGWWGGWLKATKAERAAGEVKMWQLRADILSDGERNTLIRLDHALTGYPKPSCSYFESDQMLIDLPSKVAKAYTKSLPFISSTLGNDLIYDVVSKHFYMLEWNRSSFAYVEREDAFVPNYLGGFRISHRGAKAGVVVYFPMTRGPIPICWIDWVPARQGKGLGSDKNK